MIMYSVYMDPWDTQGQSVLLIMERAIDSINCLFKLFNRTNSASDVNIAVYRTRVYRTFLGIILWTKWKRLHCNQ